MCPWMFLPGGWSWGAAVVPVGSSCSPLLCWSQTSQPQTPAATWQHRSTNILQLRNTQINSAIIWEGGWAVPYLFRASCAPGTAVSSICRVPLRSMSTAFRARLPAMLETCRGGRMVNVSWGSEYVLQLQEIQWPVCLHRNALKAALIFLIAFWLAKLYFRLIRMNIKQPNNQQRPIFNRFRSSSKPDTRWASLLDGDGVQSHWFWFYFIFFFSNRQI